MACGKPSCGQFHIEGEDASVKLCAKHYNAVLDRKPVPNVNHYDKGEGVGEPCEATA